MCYILRLYFQITIFATGDMFMQENSLDSFMFFSKFNKVFFWNLLDTGNVAETKDMMVTWLTNFLEWLNTRARQDDQIWGLPPLVYADISTLVKTSNTWYVTIEPCYAQVLSRK